MVKESNKKGKITRLTKRIDNIVREYSKSIKSSPSDDATSKAGYGIEVPNNQELVVFIASILCLAKRIGVNPSEVKSWSKSRIKQSFSEGKLSDSAWDELKNIFNIYDEEDFQEVALNSGIDPFTDLSKSAIHLALRILNIQEKEKVVDFDCGYGDFLLQASQESKNCLGYEESATASQIAVARGELAGFRIENIDKYILGMQTAEPEFDKGFQAGKWGLKVDRIPAEQDSSGKFLKATDANQFASFGTSREWIDALLMMKLLKENGKAVVLTTMGPLTNSQDMQARRYFVENKYIEAVIALPAKLFGPYTFVPCAMVVLSKNNEKVRLIDATDAFKKSRRRNELDADDVDKIMDRYDSDGEHSALVSPLEREGYNLNPKRYLVKRVAVENGVRFGDIILESKRGTQMTAKVLDEINSSEPTDTQLIRVNNIQDGSVVGELAYIKGNESLSRYYIKNEDIILSKVALPGKVAFAEVPANINWVLGANLYSLSIDTKKADPLYIKLYFESNQGMKQLTSIASGVAAPVISIEELKNMVIPLPSLEEQQKLVEVYKKALAKVESLRKEYEEAYANLKNIINQEGR